MISQDTLDEIRQRVPLNELIGSTVRLTRNGVRWKGLCPFHNEKTPSFVIFQDNSFHCFGCSEHGGAIDFTMKYEGLTFTEAVNRITKAYGIELRFLDDTRTPSSLLKTVKAVADILVLKLKEAPNLLNSLIKKGFTEEILSLFDVGFSPQYNWLVYEIVKRGIDMETWGRLKFDTQQNIFNNRLMFPITDSSGAVVGFSGRVLEKDVKPKYINSPDSDLFKKGNLLYGYSQIKTNLDYIAVVEGYTDVIAMKQIGLNSVAVMGTAPQDIHARLLKKKTDRVVLLFDGDEAGREATLKAIPIVLKGGLECLVGSLPIGVDPRDLAFQSPDLLREVIGKACNPVDYLFNCGYGDSIQNATQLADSFIGTMYEGIAVESLSKRFSITSFDARNSLALAQKEVTNIEVKSYKDDTFVLACFLLSEELYWDYCKRKNVLFDTEDGHKVWLEVVKYGEQDRIFSWDSFMACKVSDSFKEAVIREADSINLQVVKQEFKLRMNFKRLLRRQRRLSQMARQGANVSVDLNTVIEEINQSQMELETFYAT